MAKRLQELKTSRGHKTRARIHAFWSPLGQRARRFGRIRWVGALLVFLVVAAAGGDIYAEQYLSTHG